ncbi:MAG TPA: hypothetical protein P5572_06055 [Phycisphaerae bacterium]|nr:hypothetical protein [Phycisphaerae bacterium]
MSTLASDNTRFERMIAEAFAAQKAGVFASTPVDVAALVAPEAPARVVRWHERLLVGLPVAACVAAAIGMAAMWGVSTDRQAGSPLASVEPAVTSHVANLQLVADCMSGPGAAVTNGCMAADLDDDGDVDLQDMSAYQRRAAGLNK